MSHQRSRHIRSGPSIRSHQGRLTAVLGPTNTGKTHFAIERMVAHRSGMIGLPLRLLAREVFDKIVRLRGNTEVALITWEERIQFGEGKTESTQSIPDFPYHKYAELVRLWRRQLPTRQAPVPGEIVVARAFSMNRRESRHPSCRSRPY